MKSKPTFTIVFFALAVFLLSSCSGTASTAVKKEAAKSETSANEPVSSGENPLGCYRMGKSYDLAAVSKREFAVFELPLAGTDPAAANIVLRAYSFNDKCDRDMDMKTGNMGYIDHVKVTGSSVTVKNVMPGMDETVRKGTFSRRDADSFMLNAPDRGPQYFVKVK